MVEVTSTERPISTQRENSSAPKSSSSAGATIEIGVVGSAGLTVQLGIGVTAFSPRLKLP